MKTIRGKWCHFPFRYRGKVYHKCTTDRRGKLWCSTTETYRKRQGFCQGNSWRTQLLMELISKFLFYKYSLQMTNIFDQCDQDLRIQEDKYTPAKQKTTKAN